MALVVNGRYLDRPVTGVERYAAAIASLLAEEADRRVERPQGVNSCGLCKTNMRFGLGRVEPFNQRFRRFHDISRGGNPIEMRQE